MEAGKLLGLDRSSDLFRKETLDIIAFTTSPLTITNYPYFYISNYKH